jgi:hypothetical protein
VDDDQTSGVPFDKLTSVFDNPGIVGWGLTISDDLLSKNLANSRIDKRKMMGKWKRRRDGYMIDCMRVLRATPATENRTFRGLTDCVTVFFDMLKCYLNQMRTEAARASNISRL